MSPNKLPIKPSYQSNRAKIDSKIPESIVHVLREGSMMKIVHLAYKPTLLGDENVKLHADIDDFERSSRLEHVV